MLTFQRLNDVHFYKPAPNATSFTFLNLLGHLEHLSQITRKALTALPHGKILPYQEQVPHEKSYSGVIQPPVFSGEAGFRLHYSQGNHLLG